MEVIYRNTLPIHVEAYKTLRSKLEMRLNVSKMITIIEILIKLQPTKGPTLFDQYTISLDAHCSILLLSNIFIV